MSDPVINEALDVVQISDPHILATPEGSLLGLNTRQSLQAVLDAVLSNPIPDLIIASGDISQDGSVESYRAFAEMTADLACPVYWMCGNHDVMHNMQLVAQPINAFEKVIECKGWRLLLLNSATPGEVCGTLNKEELQFLRNSLQESDKNALVFLHHHPIKMGAKWLDGIGLQNNDEFLSTISESAHLRGVVWGHVHQESDRIHNGLRMLSTPSTCVQFEPQSKKFAVGKQAPGFRRLKLFPDGSIQTDVERIEHLEFEIDYDSRGY